jgi:hypothetical protein
MNYYDINMKIDKILSTQTMFPTTNNPITKIFLKINNVLTKLLKFKHMSSGNIKMKFEPLTINFIWEHQDTIKNILSSNR